MKRVINWEHYKDNWADYGSTVAELVLEACVGIVLLVLLLPAFVLVALGYTPEFDKEQQ